MTDHELELVPTDDLIEELWRRCDAGIVCLQMRPTAGESAERLQWHGGAFNAIGMARWAEKRFYQEAGRSVTEGPPEDAE
jgi:hypothetical protein